MVVELGPRRETLTSLSSPWEGLGGSWTPK